MWDYVFKVKFTTANEYMIVPLAAFAINNNAAGTCEIYMQQLEEDTVESNHVVFGSLFLQQYISWWSYDYTTSSKTLSMQLSPTCTLTYAYIGSRAYTNGQVSPFLNLGGTTQTLLVNANSTNMRTTISA